MKSTQNYAKRDQMQIYIILKTYIFILNIHTKITCVYKYIKYIVLNTYLY